MKKTITLFLICFPFFLPAQNYQNICTPGITFFRDTLLNIKAFRLDSISLSGNNDTIFLSYRAIRDTIADVFPNFHCADTTNGSILGMKIFKKHDGWFYFFNRRNDSIQINSQAGLNETWKFCDLPDSGYIQARVTSIITDSVLGTTDQVKVISFQAKDKGNNDISHFLNEKSIKLSQHHGFSIMLDVYYIPSGTAFYSVSGNTGSGLGIQNFTMKDVYNFDIGDVFHYRGSSSNQYKMSSWEIINTILGKTVFGNTDSVTYLMISCTVTDGDNIGHITTYDTVSVNYNIFAMDGDPVYSRLPNEFYGKAAFSRTASVKRISNDSYEYYGHCWVHPPFGPIVTNNYSPGLGCTFQSYIDIPSTSSQYLVYYKKGSLTWGTPVATDCSKLLGVESVTKPVERPIRVIPNPVYTKTEISVSKDQANLLLNITLYNSLGIPVYRDILNTNPYIFQRNGINAGLYLLEVTNEDGKIIGKEKVILL